MHPTYIVPRPPHGPHEQAAVSALADGGPLRLLPLMEGSGSSEGGPKPRDVSLQLDLYQLQERARSAVVSASVRWAQGAGVRAKGCCGL